MYDTISSSADLARMDPIIGGRDSNRWLRDGSGSMLDRWRQ
jgi:hypothetical protein